MNLVLSTLVTGLLVRVHPHTHLISLLNTPSHTHTHSLLHTPSHTHTYSLFSTHTHTHTHTPSQIFWYYRGALSSMMIWYVFVQCLFLLFQFITTDIFAAFEASAGGGGTTPTTQPPSTPWFPITNCTINPKACNGSNGSNGSNSTLFFGPTYEQKYIAY